MTTHSRTGSLVGAAGAAFLLLAACGTSGSSSGSAYGAQPRASRTSAATGSGSTVGTAGSKLGTILVTPRKMTMYAFAIDTPGHSRCSGSCAAYWPPVPAADAPKASPQGVTATFGAITRSDGSKQLTVNGYPMYTYASDTSPGQVTGQGINASGGLWWAVSPNGSWDKTSG